MAGVSAGKTLTQHGIEDFKILEYQDRIGGRTLHAHFGTKTSGGSWTVELGTNWVSTPSRTQICASEITGLTVSHYRSQVSIVSMALDHRKVL